MTSAEATSIDERLRFALSAPLESFRDGVDMSTAAIAQRLHDACDMASLCLQLANAMIENEP